MSANAQSLATADAIAEAQRMAVERERERCKELARYWIGLFLDGKASAYDALLEVNRGIGNPNAGLGKSQDGRPKIFSVSLDWNLKRTTFLRDAQSFADLANYTPSLIRLPRS